MSGFEWFLLIVVVIAVPLVVAVAVTLWTLEQARLRNRRNREETGASGEPVKRRATREPAMSAAADDVATRQSGIDVQRRDADDGEPVRGGSESS